MKEIEIGNLYDINKNLVQKYEKELTKEELEIKKGIIDAFVNKNLYHYYMLLCHERRDYTVFEFENEKTMEKTENLVDILVDECLKNRGKIYSINEDIDGNAIEIWLSIDGGAYCYYLFPYDDAIILV